MFSLPLLLIGLLTKHWWHLFDARNCILNLDKCLLQINVPSVLWRCWLVSRKAFWPVVGCWHGYLSAVRCRFSYGPADACVCVCVVCVCMHACMHACMYLSVYLRQDGICITLNAVTLINVAAFGIGLLMSLETLNFQSFFPIQGKCSQILRNDSLSIFHLAQIDQIDCDNAVCRHWHEWWPISQSGMGRASGAHGSMHLWLAASLNSVDT